MKNNICSICGKKYDGFDNNARPINNGRCCDECRLSMMLGMINNNFKK